MAATLIKNSVSVAPGFHIGNVFVMAGVPMVMRAMLEAIVTRLPRGVPVTVGDAVSAELPEGAIAQGLAEIQKDQSANRDRLLSLVPRRRAPARSWWRAARDADGGGSGGQGHRSDGHGTGRARRAACLVQLQVLGFGVQRRQDIGLVAAKVLRAVASASLRFGALAQHGIGADQALPAGRVIGIVFQPRRQPATIALGSGAAPPPCAVSRAMRSTSI